MSNIQNLREEFLYSKLPAGIIELDHQGLIAAVIGGISDRVEDIRSYAKKYELFFDTHGLTDSNSVVLVTFQTTYGKVVTRSLDINDATPTEEGQSLNQWVSDQIGVDISQVTSAVFGQDLLRSVDINTLEYLAASIGAVLYTTAAQSGDKQLNQQRILNSYFPRLKIKGTAQSFDALGKLIGFDDVRLTPLWGRVSPRLPNDPGNAVNDPDFAERPAYQPQQQIGPSYDPHQMRDGLYYAWAGTASANPGSTSFYSQVVNGFQPWVQVDVTGTVAHPPIGSSVVLSGGGPHTKASAVAGDGLLFTALGEGESFNGLVVRFDSWNSGTDRTVSITDRLSTIKYRTSHYDLYLTVEDDHAIAQFGTLAAKRNPDLAVNPKLTADGTAASPYRPWRGGSSTSGEAYVDFTYQLVSAPVPVTPRTQATSKDQQIDTDALRAASVQAVQVMEEVRPATRQPRDISVGFLTKDGIPYAAYKTFDLLGTMFGTRAIDGVAASHPLAPYELSVVMQGTTFSSGLTSEEDATSNGTLVMFGNGSGVSGVYDLSSNYFRFTNTSVALSPLVFSAYWSITDSTVVRVDPGTNPSVLKSYQLRPEDEVSVALQTETVDEVPWRRDLIGGGELVEVISDPGAITPPVARTLVANSISVGDHTGAEYNVYGVTSSALPVRTIAIVKDLAAYTPGQIAIAYKGSFRDLNSITAAEQAIPNVVTDLSTYFNPGSALYHVGLAQGVLVADLPRFFGLHHRSGLVGWLPLNEHPDEGAIARDASVSNTNQTLSGFSLSGVLADRKWDSQRGWYLRVQNGASIMSGDHRQITDNYSVSLWINPDATVASAGTATVFSHGPLSVDLINTLNQLRIYAQNQTGTRQVAGSVQVVPGTFTQVAVTLNGPYVQFGTSTLGSPLVLSTGTLDSGFMSFRTAGDALSVQSGTARGFGVQDVRLWNTVKTQDELNTVRNHNPTPTVCTYWPTNIELVDSGDRYGLNVSDAGFVYPAAFPGAIRMNQQARIQRYDDLARYHGESRFEEVGLGGGPNLPAIYQLGQQFFNICGNGTTVVGSQLGAMPGWNNIWYTGGTVAGQYIELIGTGSTSNGIAPTYRSASPNPWPVKMENTNPCRDVAWIGGDNGYVYEITLQSAAAQLQATLSGTRVARISSAGTIADQPTGAAVVLASSGTQLTSDATGKVYQRFTNFPVTTPPLYMYLNTRVTDDVQDAFTRWTESGDQRLFGNKLSNPSAALDDNGTLEFENTSNLSPGRYRLSIISGNIGKVDSDFDGFSVEITIDTLLLQARLCQGQSGTDFFQTDVLEFDITDAVSANWFLSVLWTNSFSDPSKGVARQFKIFSYKLEKIQTELYAVTISGSGTLPTISYIDTGTFAGTIPGGWLATINSYGSVCQYRHESRVYSGNDTVQSKLPLSSVLTSDTGARREDHYSKTAFVLLDSGTQALPVFSNVYMT